MFEANRDCRYMERWLGGAKYVSHVNQTLYALYLTKMTDPILSHGNITVICAFFLIPHCFLHETHGRCSLSFYKEHMDGETNNYVTMRADAEATTAVNVLSALAEEALDYSRKVVTLAAGDDELLHTWELFVQVRGYHQMSETYSVRSMLIG